MFDDLEKTVRFKSDEVAFALDGPKAPHSKEYYRGLKAGYDDILAIIQSNEALDELNERRNLLWPKTC